MLKKNVKKKIIKQNKVKNEKDNRHVAKLFSHIYLTVYERAITLVHKTFLPKKVHKNTTLSTQLCVKL